VCLSCQMLLSRERKYLRWAVEIVARRGRADLWRGKPNGLKSSWRCCCWCSAQVLSRPTSAEAITLQPEANNILFFWPLWRDDWNLLIAHTQKKTKSLKDTKRWICLNLVIPPSKASFPAKENNKQSVSEMEKKRTEGKKKKRCCLTERGCTHTLSGRYSNLDWAFWEPPTSDSKRTHTHTVLHSREKKKRGAREDKSNPLEGAVLYTKREWYCWFLISAI